MNCEETRRHLESCEECGLHIAVEARLRALPVLDPPPGLARRVLAAVRPAPAPGSIRREMLRLAAAAALLVGLAAGGFSLGLDRHAAVEEIRARGGEVLRSVASTLHSWRILP
jgi:hypothetical protein